jgi:hypothetical protein
MSSIRRPYSYTFKYKSQENPQLKASWVIRVVESRMVNGIMFVTAPTANLRKRTFGFNPEIGWAKRTSNNLTGPDNINSLRVGLSQGFLG